MTDPTKALTIINKELSSEGGVIEVEGALRVGWTHRRGGRDPLAKLTHCAVDETRTYSGEEGARERELTGLMSTQWGNERVFK